MDLVAILGTAGIVVGTVAVGLLIDRYVTRVIPRAEDLARDPRRDHAPGTAPATAIACGPRRRQRIAGRQRCDCGARMTRASEDVARLGDRDLAVIRLRCPGCGAARSLYFVPPGEP